MVSRYGGGGGVASRYGGGESCGGDVGECQGSSSGMSRCVKQSMRRLKRRRVAVRFLRSSAEVVRRGIVMRLFLALLGGDCTSLNLLVRSVQE